MSVKISFLFTLFRIFPNFCKYYTFWPFSCRYNIEIWRIIVFIYLFYTFKQRRSKTTTAQLVFSMIFWSLIIRSPSFVRERWVNFPMSHSLPQRACWSPLMFSATVFELMQQQTLPLSCITCKHKQQHEQCCWSVVWFFSQLCTLFLEIPILRICKSSQLRETPPVYHWVSISCVFSRRVTFLIPGYTCTKSLKTVKKYARILVKESAFWR